MQCDKSGTLMLKTKELLIKDSRSLPQLSVDSGLPFYWLQKFSSNGFENPSVNRVQYLYEFLTNTKLPV